jgi:hypothetical protein
MIPTWSHYFLVYIGPTLFGTNNIRAFVINRSDLETSTSRRINCTINCPGDPLVFQGQNDKLRQ